MTTKQVITRLRDGMYDPRKCTECRGTGTKVGRKAGTQGSGCAPCLVGRVMGVRISPKMARFIIKKLERIDRHANAK